MNRDLSVIIMIGAGALIALQAPVNERLSNSVGTWQAATVSFAVGTAALAILALSIGGGLASLKGVVHVPWYYVLGGLLGAFYVTVALVSVRVLGVLGVTAATIFGQLLASAAADRVGFLDYPVIPFTWQRAVGVGLLAAGTWLVIHR